MTAPPIRVSDQRRKRVLAGCLVFALAAAVIAAFTSQAEDWQPLSLVLVLAGFTVASELMPIRQMDLPASPWVYTSAAPLVLAMTLLGPAPAFTIGVIGLITAAIRERKSFHRCVLGLANYATFLVGGSLLSLWLIDLWALTPEELPFAALVVVVYLCVEATSTVMHAIHGVLYFGDSFRDHLRKEQIFLGSDAFTAFLTGFTAYVYGTTGLAALGLLALVQLAHQYLATRLMISHERAEALEVQAKRLADLSASRGRLVGQVLQAEETERRRLADALHDEALQELLFIRQRLTASQGGSERTGAALERAIAQLRSEIFDLHPAVLEHAGLAVALAEVADIQAERAGFRAEVEVDPSACGQHDQLLFVLGREQLTNAAKHSGATEVELAIARSNGRVIMEVSDNGCGIDADGPGAALERGHIGLATSAERIEAIGGTFEIDSAPGRGTRVRTTLPLGDA